MEIDEQAYLKDKAMTYMEGRRMERRRCLKCVEDEPSFSYEKVRRAKRNITERINKDAKTTT